MTGEVKSPAGVIDAAMDEWHAGPRTKAHRPDTMGVLAALSAAGFVVVPREPTEAMVLAGVGACPPLNESESHVEVADRMWSAMLAALEG